MLDLALAASARRTAVAFVLAAAASASLADEDALVLYPAFAPAGGALVVQGRLIERRDAPAPAAGDSWWTNLRRNLGMLINDEREGSKVAVRLEDGDAWEAATDAEGYFEVAPPGAAAAAPGWHRVLARSGEASAEGAALFVPAGNTLGVIADLDDTLLVSDVGDKRKLLAHSLLKNPLQRAAVPGAAALLRAVAATNPVADATPLVYLSASPRQLSTAIQRFLDHNGFPSGILITKRVTNDATSEPLTDQTAYKTAHIEDIFARLPQVRFVLIGDDGERDPEIYRDVQHRHPDRVQAVWIRRVSADPARPAYAGQTDLAIVLARRDPLEATP